MPFDNFCQIIVSLFTIVEVFQVPMFPKKKRLKVPMITLNVVIVVIAETIEIRSEKGHIEVILNLKPS